MCRGLWERVGICTCVCWVMGEGRDMCVEGCGGG